MAWITTPYDPITPFMNAVEECLCTELVRAGRPVVSCGQYAGDQPAPADDCACTDTILVEDPNGGGTVEMEAWGQARVRLEYLPGQSYNRRSARQLGTPGGLGCETGTPWIFVVSMEVHRCISTPADNGRPPTVQQQRADALEWYADVAVLRRVFDCCPVIVGAELDRAEPLGPEGGCLGAVLRFWIEFPLDQPPEPDPPPDLPPGMGFGPRPVVDWR